MRKYKILGLSVLRDDWKKKNITIGLRKVERRKRQNERL